MMWAKSNIHRTKEEAITRREIAPLLTVLYPGLAGVLVETDAVSIEIPMVAVRNGHFYDASKL